MLDISEKDYLNTILAFDYGEARIGVAIKPANQAEVEPVLTLDNDQSIERGINDLVDLHNPGLIVVGWPRNLEGEKTAQTEKAERFASELEQRYNIKVELQDEALSTEQAESRIPANLRSKRREFIDQYAACIILENYLQEK
jgi:putative Holliday junction resolvase